MNIIVEPIKYGSVRKMMDRDAVSQKRSLCGFEPSFADVTSLFQKQRGNDEETFKTRLSFGFSEIQNHTLLHEEGSSVASSRGYS